MQLHQLSLWKKNITVTASIDPSIDILKADGAALPSNVSLNYSPGTKSFTSEVIQTAIYTNDVSKGVNVYLNAEPKLTHTTDTSKQINMEISFGGKKLTTTPQKIDANALNFGASGNDNVSGAQELVIGTTTQTSDPTADQYQGVVSLVVVQDTSTS